MLRKGLVGAAVAVLALGSAAFADDANAAAPAGNEAQVNSNMIAALPQQAINPVYWDDQVPRRRRRRLRRRLLRLNPCRPPHPRQPRLNPRALSCGDWIKSRASLK